MPRPLTGAGVLTTAAVTALLLTACSSGDDSADPSGGAGTTSPTSGTSAAGTTEADPVTLGLTVGDCVADLGDRGAAEDTGEEPGEDTGDATGPATTSETPARGVRGAGSGTVAPSGTEERTTRSAPQNDDGGDRDGDGVPDEPRDTASASEPGVLDDTVPDSATGVTKTDCDLPHVGEVFEQRELDNEVLFPGQKMNRLTAAVCTGDAFEDYIGYPFAYSVFDVVTYAPSKESWARGDRTVTCVVTDPSAGYIPGTLKDAGY